MSIQVLCVFCNRVTWFLLRCRSLLHSVTINPLSDTQFAAILCVFVGCFSAVDSFLWCAEVNFVYFFYFIIFFLEVNFDVVLFLCFFLGYLYFGVTSKKPSASPASWSFPSCSLLGDFLKVCVFVRSAVPGLSCSPRGRRPSLLQAGSSSLWPLNS